jgi:hypothetical protein
MRKKSKEQDGKFHHELCLLQKIVHYEEVSWGPTTKDLPTV